jgi:hypothetical protein
MRLVMIHTIHTDIYHQISAMFTKIMLDIGSIWYILAINFRYTACQLTENLKYSILRF